MNRDPQEVYDAWLHELDRHVMVVDEVRFPIEKTGVAGERLVYVVVCLRAAALVSFINEVDDFRMTLPEQDRHRKLKAKKIFTRPSYKKLRSVVGLAIARSEFVQRYATSTEYLLREHKNSSGPAARVTDGTVLDGHELPVLQLVLKHAANQWAGAAHVDVIVDRSAQLGMKLWQRGKDGRGVGFESFYVGAGELNSTSAGSPSQTVTEATFNIFAVGEETPQFGDGVLLADSAGYLTFQRMGAELRDPRLDGGVVPFPPVSGRSFFDL